MRWISGVCATGASVMLAIWAQFASSGGHERQAQIALLVAVGLFVLAVCFFMAFAMPASVRAWQRWRRERTRKWYSKLRSPYGESQFEVELPFPSVTGIPVSSSGYLGIFELLLRNKGHAQDITSVYMRIDKSGFFIVRPAPDMGALGGPLDLRWEVLPDRRNPDNPYEPPNFIPDTWRLTGPFPIAIGGYGDVVRIPGIQLDVSRTRFKTREELQQAYGEWTASGPHKLVLHFEIRTRDGAEPPFNFECNFEPAPPTASQK